MGSKFTSVTMGGRGVTLWEEGADSMTDYFPAMHGLSQKFALAMLAEHGTTEGCSVETTNSRRCTEPEGKAEKQARRFAAKAGLPYREQVFFPCRGTRLEAVADAALVPGAVVMFVGDEWVEGYAKPVPAYRGAMPGETGRGQIVARPWLELVA
jgi:hypothetical protein